MSERLIPLSNSPVTNLPFNCISILQYLGILVKHTLNTLVCSVLSFQGLFCLIWVELPQLCIYVVFVTCDFFIVDVNVCHNCFPVLDCLFYLSFARIWAGFLARSFKASFFWVSFASRSYNPPVTAVSSTVIGPSLLFPTDPFLLKKSVHGVY